MIISCGNKESKDENINSNLELKVRPFYRSFADLDTQSFAQSLHSLKNQYPDFTDFFLDTLLPFNEVGGQYEDTARTRAIKNIFSFEDYTHLTDTVLRVFPDTKVYDKQIEDMLNRVAHHFPKWDVPTQVTYFVSCLNFWTAVSHSSGLAIGLDMFLGPNFLPYQAISMPHYVLINHTPENIPLWAAKAVYADNFEQLPVQRDLLELMLIKGKEILFLEKVLPKFKFDLIMGWTPEQLKWAEESEAYIFNMFMQQGLLFNKDLQQIMRYVTPGPNSAGFPPEAPGNLGTYIGYKILKSYQEHNSASLQEILDIADANAIFQQSKYKP